MKLAIQEDLLSGRSPRERFARARDLGFDGLAFWARGLSQRMDAASDGLMHSGLKAAVVSFGRQPGLLDASPYERDLALVRLRQAIMDAVDLGAPGVSVPLHDGPVGLPDLSPWMSSVQACSELLNAHLRTLEDYALALGAALYLEPASRYETGFVNRLDQAATAARRRKHTHIRVTADVYAMALEQRDLPGAIAANADVLGLVQLAETDRGLPGGGLMPLDAIAEALRAAGYSGWVTVSCGECDDPEGRAEDCARALPVCVERLRLAGF